MMAKTAYYAQMAEEAARQVTGSREQWTAFLTTAARLYKYPYAEQLMIFTQRPDATACAEYDLWNNRMNRYVKRGSKGIALLDMRGGEPKLRYVFDVSDTGERRNSRPVQLWKMEREHEEPIIAALDKAFGVSEGAGPLEDHIMEAAEHLAQDYWEEHKKQIGDIVADSYLEGYDEFNIGVSFKRAAATSIAYTVFTRTVGSADDYFEHEDFLDIFDFNTQAASNVLGTAVSEMSSQIFREIERTIRNYERTKQAERSQNYDRAELHEERGLSDSGHPVAESGEEALGQVRQDAQSVPSGEQHAAVQSPDPDREAVSSPVGDSGDGSRTDGAVDGGTAEAESGTGQEAEPASVGAAHEPVESTGRGSHSDGAYQQLSFMHLFQSEEEQITKIDQAAKQSNMKAESGMPSAFTISEEEIDRMLRVGSGFEGGKIRIYALYQQQGEAKERADFLKAEYGTGGHSFTFTDGTHGFADHNAKGIQLRSYEHDREIRLTWGEVDKRLDSLIQRGQYLSTVEQEKYQELEQEFGAALPMPTPAHIYPVRTTEPVNTGNQHLDEMLNQASELYARSELAAPERFIVMETDDGYAVWDEIQEGIHVEPDGVSEEFSSEWEAETYRQQLIEKVQEREAKDWLYVEQSKQNLQQDIPFPDVESEEVQEPAHAETDPLVLEMQEHARELARESGYAPDERFVVTMTGKNFPDSKDAFAIWDYVKEEYYGYSDGNVQTFADYVSASEALQEIRERNMEAEKERATVHPEPAAPVQPDYRVGDTLYLDGKAFAIEKVGLFDVQLRDPDSVYPIFRSESKENLARLLGHEDSVHLHNIMVDLRPQTQIESTEENTHIPEKAATDAGIPTQNFRIVDDHLGEGGAKQKFRANMDAIHTLQAIEEADRNATPEEQEILSKYVGWGGLSDAFDESKPAWASEYQELKAALTDTEYAAARASVLNAHYTSPTVIRAIYEAVGNMGFQSGNILEPSMGVGNFFGMMPEGMTGSKLYGVELDSITGRIAQKLYPLADIKVAGFETTDRRDFYDLAVGNVPFGNYKVNDKPYNKLGFSIHNYFFAKALDQVRPGGVVAFVTSRYTMDSKNPDARKYLAQRAELLGAIRLPNNAFRANAGTDVVSDIIFLQKRDHPIDIEPDWVHLGLTPEGISLNSYFVDHPEMVLGELTTESTQYGKEECTVLPIEGAVLSEQLHEAIQNFGGHYVAQELAEEDDLTLQGDTIPADPNVKNFSYTVVDGSIYFRENSIMRKAELSETATGRIKGMVELRGIVQELMEYQLQDYPDEEIAAKQRELNVSYDRFTDSYGLINSRANAQAFSEDSSYYLLCSLENVDENGRLESKADMFTKRTIRPDRAVTSVDTPAEALAISIGECGRVDLPYMAVLLDTPGEFDVIKQELQGVIFKDPMSGDEEESGWQTADEYLSGNVREKLRIAELSAAENSAYAVNVEYLKRAQPKDLEASEIDVRLGATWVDRGYIQDFMEETFEPPFYMRRSIEVKFSPMTAEWQITGKSALSKNDVHAYVTYGTSRANAYRILEDTLNLRDVRIYDTIEDADGKQKRVLNKKETTLAQQKQQAIKDAFQNWVWKEPHRREALVRTYNKLFNSTRPREYDGSHIRFGGMNPEIRLREHQQNAIAHVMYGGNTLLAHEVGAGKTFEMAASAMEMKRLGLCQKSLFVVPNHLTLQWANEFLRLYPNAKLLVASKKDFETARRKKFCARIATGDYDAVIIGHSQFEKIPVSPERQERILTAQIDEIEAAIAEMKSQRGEKFSIKQMEKTRKTLETKLEKLKATERKDDVITFEQLGVDRLFVDEAHGFKNLFLYTKMRNVAGLSTSEAQKSSDMFMKCQYMDELTGGRGIIFATGTPVSNSMTELYTMMRYLQYSTLQQKGLTHFDSWASTFGETTTAIELAPEGTGYRARTRFAKFFNLPELMNMFKETADIKTSDQLHLPVPEAKFETVVVQPSEFQQSMVQELSERAAAVHSGVVDPSVDNMLKITSDGRKLGLDQRLMNPLLPDDPDSKLNACVKNVLRIYEEGKSDKLTQLLFCDLSTPKSDGTFNVYADIRAKLMNAGVPESEIAFIHDADTETKKKDLFAKVRTGQVRVLLGSTQKMGAGTNVQDRLVAVHHLDVGWRPADMTQRNGRIIRQGNRNKQVQIYQYVTEGTFDAYLYQTLENKAKFIGQIMTSKSPVRSCDDVDEQALSYAEIKALCAGDPKIKEKMDLDVDVARLKVLKADHQSQQYRLEDKLLKFFPAEIEKMKGFIKGFQADIQTAAAHPMSEDGFCGMEVNGHVFAEKAEAGEAILEACKTYQGLDPVPLGSYRGFQMELCFDSFAKEFQIALKGEMTHRIDLGNSGSGNIQRLDNALAGIPARLEKSEQQLESLNSQQEAARAEVGKPFPQESELTQKSARLAELDAMLNMDGQAEEEEHGMDEKPSVLAELRDRSGRIPPTDHSGREEAVL